MIRKRRALLDPVLERMMAAVHHYEGTVNQVMGDGIMALFGAPLAHEDHAVRACYAALTMQVSMKEYAEHLHRTQGVPLHIRVGLNAGEVVVRAIGSNLHMDYTTVGQTTHLAARMERIMIHSRASMLPADMMEHGSSRFHVSHLVTTQPLIGDQDHRCVNCHGNPGWRCGRGPTTPRTIQGDDVRHRLQTGLFEGIPTRDVHARTCVITALSELDAPGALPQPLLTRP